MKKTLLALTAFLLTPAFVAAQNKTCSECGKIFSDEEGTPSFEMDGKLDEETKQSRRDAVMEHQLRVSEALNEQKIGKVYEVIVDEIIDDGVYSGRTRYDSPEIDCNVTFESDEFLEPGDIVTMKYDDENKQIMWDIDTPDDSDKEENK